MSRTLDEVIEDLSYGSLSNLAIGNSGEGSIPLAKQNQITHLINRGLTKLHSRFVLYQRELFIRVLEGVSMYPLIVEASTSYVDLLGYAPSLKYIIDDEEAPFPADVIRILEAWKPHPCNNSEILQIGVNDPQADDSVFTPASDVIQISGGKAEDIYQFMYQANHYKLLPNVGQQIIYLPDALYEALEHYVAYKMFSAMNGEEHKINSAAHLASYNAVLQTNIDLDLVREVPVYTNRKLEDRGFK